jgi:hypothetical protein
MRRLVSIVGLMISAQSLGQGADTNSPNTLSGCAAIDEPGQRLGCYDQLAGRASRPPPSAATATAARNDSFGLPAAHPAPPPAVAPVPASPQSFGLYAAEHPLPPADLTLSAKVTGFGASSGGHPTVSLEGGQLWELLDEADPLLSQGQTVTIRRGSLGSFLMTTPAKRTHRVHRLK